MYYNFLLDSIFTFVTFFIGNMFLPFLHCLEHLKICYWWCVFFFLHFFSCIKYHIIFLCCIVATAHGKTLKMSYKNYKTKFEVDGLPEGISLKKPSYYGKSDCKKILELKDLISVRLMWVYVIVSNKYF